MPGKKSQCGESTFLLRKRRFPSEEGKEEERKESVLKYSADAGKNLDMLRTGVEDLSRKQKKKYSQEKEKPRHSMEVS